MKPMFNEVRDGDETTRRTTPIAIPFSHFPVLLSELFLVINSNNRETKKRQWLRQGSTKLFEWYKDWCGSERLKLLFLQRPLSPISPRRRRYNATRNFPSHSLLLRSAPFCFHMPRNPSWNGNCGCFLVPFDPAGAFGLLVGMSKTESNSSSSTDQSSVVETLVVSPEGGVNQSREDSRTNEGGMAASISSA